jgi:hypothetical protein
MRNERSGRIVHARYEPPQNELPVALATPHIAWRGDGIVIAVPSLLVYSAGTELLILCCARSARIRDHREAGEVARSLQNLTANGQRVQLLVGAHREHSFTYRAWVEFGPWAPGGDIEFELEFPGVERALHRVAGVREVSSSAEVLW